MTFIEMSRSGPPLFIRPEMVAAIRPARQGEAGESVIVLSSGAELVCGYDAGHARARLSRDWPVEPPPFDTNESAVAPDVLAALNHRLETAIEHV